MNELRRRIRRRLAYPARGCRRKITETDPSCLGPGWFFVFVFCFLFLRKKRCVWFQVFGLACLLTLRPLCFLLPNVPPAASPACSPHQRQQEVQPQSRPQPKLFWEKRKKIERTRRRRRQDPWAVALTSTETSPCRLTLPGILRRATRPRLLLSSNMSPGRKILNWVCRRINSWSVKVGRFPHTDY